MLPPQTFFLQRGSGALKSASPNRGVLLWCPPYLQTQRPPPEKRDIPPLFKPYKKGGKKPPWGPFPPYLGPPPKRGPPSRGIWRPPEYCPQRRPPWEVKRGHGKFAQTLRNGPNLPSSEEQHHGKNPKGWLLE